MNTGSSQAVPEPLAQIRTLLRPMVGRGGFGDQVYGDIAASGLVPILLSWEPTQLIAKATEFFDQEDELLSFLLQLTRIYTKANAMRGLAFSAYHLARIHQRTWPVETAHMYTPLLQLVVGILETKPDLREDERGLLPYALEHLGYACEDRRDFKGAVNALWKGSHLAEQQNDIPAALHLCVYLLGANFAKALGTGGLPGRDAVIERLDGLRGLATSPEHTLPAVLAIATVHINKGDAARGRRMIEEILAQLPQGPADGEYRPYWEQARTVLAMLKAREGAPPEIGPDIRRLAEVEALVQKDRFVDAWEILRNLPVPKDAGPAVDYYFLRAHCLLQFARLLESFAEIEQALGMVDRFESEDVSSASQVTLYYRLTGRRNVRGVVVALRGEVLHRLRRFEEAAASYRQAIRLMSETGFKGVIWVQHNLGNLMREHGQLTDAEATYEECIRMARDSGEARVLVRATGNLGLLRMGQGRFAEGIAALSEAVELAKQHGDAWAAAHFQTNLATYLLEALEDARSSEGFDLLDRTAMLTGAVADLEVHGNELMRVTGMALRARLAVLDGHRADAAESFKAFWASLQEQIDQSPGAQDIANILRSHTSSLRAMAQFFFEEDDLETASRACELGRDSAFLLLQRESAPPPASRVSRALREALEHASNALAIASADLHFGRLQQGSTLPLHRAREEYRAVCERIAEIDPEWAQANFRLTSDAPIEDVDLLVDLCETGAGTHLIFRNRKGASRAFLPASELSAIDAMVRELYPEHGGPNRDPSLIDNLLRTAGEILFPIWKDHLPQADGRVVFIPSGRWVGVPLHAVEHPETHAPLDASCFVGTAPSLGALRRAHGATVVHRDGLLVGDPEDSLDWAGVEADILMQRYGGLFEGPLIGSAATVERVLQRTSKSGWLHFSCHGLFNPMFPSQSVLQLADGQLSAARLLRAGRGFAGVVLSACEVGRSAADGLDPLGMAGLFLAAGARCVLAPLWEIDDEASMQFGELLYRHLESAPLGIAVTRARRDLRSMDSFRSPVYWAAFQASGAPFHAKATPFAD